MKKGVLGIIAVAIFLLVIYVQTDFSLETKSDVSSSPSERALRGLAEKKILGENEIRAKMEAFEREHSQALSIYRVLEKNKGDFEEISRICKGTDPIYCYKWASNVNPDLTEEICSEFVIELKKKYGDGMGGNELNDFVKGHKFDCDNNIQQLLR